MAGSSEKEDYYIRKFDGTNFTIWKQRMMDVFVNKGLATPLKDRKEGVYNDDQWEELDARAKGTIRLHLGESIFFTIMDKTTAFELRDSLCSAWDGKSASNKVFLMKKLMRLSMKEERAESSSQALRRSTQLSHAPERLQPGLNYVLVTDCGEPSCYKKAIQMDDSVKWEQAMQSAKYNSIIANETWELIELPQGKQALPCKWVYKKKYTAEDPEPKYKARLVAKGFKQKKGVDFDEIFSPVVKMTTLRLVLGLVVATEDLELNQMDVKTAFLHGDLEEDVYIVQPEGFEMESKKPKRAKLVCRLCKALYGIKQGSRQWYLKFDKYMQSQGYEKSQEDHCLYIWKLSDDSLIILILYMDDMLIARKSKDEIFNLKRLLSTQFAKWLAHLVGDLGIHQILVLHCDSQSAITLAKNPVFHSKMKDIEV
ncbi:hypothetical protein L7F22_057150 [Adiantum nelumboides]|nr:hypothetical protein [Adiantum nelumboides]